MNGIVVMKFGGTSVESAQAIARTAEIVRTRLALGQKPVVVVSAMARATDQLLSAGNAAGRGDKSAALAFSSQLRNRHLEAADALFAGRQEEQEQILRRSAPLNDKSEEQILRRSAPQNDKSNDVIHAGRNWIDAEFDALDDLLRGICAVGELTARTLDMVASYGERLTSRLVGEYYAHIGLTGIAVDARTCIITNNDFGKAAPQQEKIAERCAANLAPLLAEGRVPVLGGFIGSTPEGQTTTLGRGGSDYTGALLGGALTADAIEIWTDVDGILTTDPRICSGALRVRHISFEEAAELAYFGAKVLHPATILPAVQQNIPVYVLNSKNPSSPGTRITAVAPRSRSPFKSIAVKRRLTIVDVVASRMLMSHGYLSRIFAVFDKHKCPVDLVSTSEVSVSLTVDSTMALPEMAADLSALGDVKYEGRKALICMVGDDIRGQNGIAAQVFAAVRGVNVRMISQGASEINMSFVIEEDDVERAVRSLHEHFFRDADPEIFDAVGM